MIKLDNPETTDMDLFDIASEHVTRRVPLAKPTDTVAQLRLALCGGQYDSASLVVVCAEGDYFLGVLSIEKLLGAAEDTRIADLMDANAPSVCPEADKEVALWHAVQHGEAALSVVDKAGRFVGVIPPDQLLAVLLQEHDEDLARLGGYLKSSTTARLASEEPVHRRFWHRVPWLLLGLAGALFAANIIGFFEAALEKTLLLAYFLPGIVYLADAVGTQTETVVVRGLSVGVSIRRILLLELITGILIGLSLALIAGPFIWWWWGDARVALTVGFAIFAASSVATIVAMLFPWLLNRMNVDPAFGSGPLATVAQDLLSIVLYFVIATAILI